MRNWNGLKERYLKDELPIRLGNLASNLTRIKSRCQNVANRELVESLLQESKLFIEWTARDAEVEIAAELVELQIQLSLWHYCIGRIWDDGSQRMLFAEQAKVWSERVLTLSGLLSVS
ncbi:hypothetical protein NG798_24810 [Ancylothrix sp. C2]|uniref:hypothetical protein n=1 Tax=Ancylothrix sp. D3o TaxID=2953691 RepID=UPI0021BA4641|nr:hypothetical protein [Ancylothrix sp. D3o]MCT7953023.1 hypothetical protein [Ancylothrix sp. D3o]